MLTRSKCTASPEAAGEKNWEMERASDTFHPPTTVVATPDPILAQSEPPPNPTFGSLTEKQPVTSKDQSGESTYHNVINNIATNLNHKDSPESPVLASPTLRPATVASRVEPQLLPTRAGLLDNLTTTTVVTDCNIYTGIPRPTSAVAESSFAIPQHTQSALSVGETPLFTNINIECDSGSEISEVWRARNISPARDKLCPPNRPPTIRNYAGFSSLNIFT